MFKTCLRVLAFPLFILSLHIVATLAGWYWQIANFDKLMHTLGGMSIAVSAFGLYALLHKRKLVGNNHPFVISVAVIAIVVFAAVAWEWMEFLIDTFAGTRMQISLTDTIGDLLAGMLGGAAISIIKPFLPRKK